MSDILDKVLQETVTWENKPINELLGATAASGSDYSKQIIMYGPTQVGKTTLILDLIGTKSDKREELDKILKGGSKAGAASTSSAIIYSKWARDKFGFATQNIHGLGESKPEELSAEEFKNKIRFINEQNRTTGGQSTKLSDIYCYYIPQEYFDESAPLQNLQIIDLPGFGERNEKMRKRADEIVSFVSQIVAGAIVVVKSENIQKLESDYKDFISKHHLNHIAIAVSYAAATDFNIKNTSTKNMSDEDLATDISKYYYDLIKSDHYMNFGNIEPDEIIFPVEKKVYLEEHSQHLTGAFDVIRKKLMSRVAAMCNRTSINYCIEKLEHKNQTVEEEIEKAQLFLEKEIQKEKDLQKRFNDLEEKIKKVHSQSSENANNISFLQKSKDEILLCAENFKKKRFTEAAAESLWSDVQGLSEHGRNTHLYGKLTDYVSECIGDKSNKDDSWYMAAKNAADKQIGEFDFKEFFKGRGLFWPRRKWCENAAYEMNRFFNRVAVSVETAIRKDTSLNAKLYEQEALESELREKNDALTELCNKIKGCQKNQIQKSNYIKEAQNDIKNNLARRENVKKVFIKHFYLKKQELEQRIESEPCAELKTALFLVLSSIYLNMKPYLEEDENE